MGHRNVKYILIKNIKVNEDGEKAETYGVEGSDGVNQIHFDDLSTNSKMVKSFIDLLNNANIQLNSIEHLVLSFFAN